MTRVLLLRLQLFTTSRRDDGSFENIPIPVRVGVLPGKTDPSKCTLEVAPGPPDRCAFLSSLFLSFVFETI